VSSTPKRRAARELRDELHRIDGRPYPAYRDLEACEYDFDGRFSIVLQHCQSDPFAPPSRCYVLVPLAVAGFPSTCLAPKIREIAFRDYLARRFSAAASRAGADVRTQQGGWHGGKGGEIGIDGPGQHVIERSAVVISDGHIEARFTVALPAQGRSIMGGWAAQIFTDTLPRLVEAALFFSACPATQLSAHLDSVEDQHAARQQLSQLGLVAFVGDGAILPRKSGAADEPMAAVDAQRFASPPSMSVALSLPHRGEVSGMGVRRGVTLIVGGGFHGKSTLLQALQLGVYDKVVGDGRELVVTDPQALKIKAEDGRAVTRCDISPFIDHLPFGRRTHDFSTADASGSTSQAAAISEALEVGATTLLLDEDTCATNFMIRDERMQLLVAPDKEPIRPFVSRVRPLWVEHGVSTIMVVGGAGDFFDMADAVILMNEYAASDATAEAKAIASRLPLKPAPPPATGAFSSLPHRCPTASGLAGGHKVSVSRSSVRFGDLTELDVASVEQLVEPSQTRAIAEALQRLASSGLDGTATLNQLLKQLEAAVDRDGLDALRPGFRLGNVSRPRKLELASAFNRLRTLEIPRRLKAEGQ